jgi:hypothetical protein
MPLLDCTSDISFNLEVPRLDHPLSDYTSDVNIDPELPGLSGFNGKTHVVMREIVIEVQKLTII